MSSITVSLSIVRQNCTAARLRQSRKTFLRLPPDCRVLCSSNRSSWTSWQDRFCNHLLHAGRRALSSNVSPNRFCNSKCYIDDSRSFHSIANVMKSSGCNVEPWMLELPKPSKNLKKERRKKPVERKDIGGAGKNLARKDAKNRRWVTTMLVTTLKRRY